MADSTPSADSALSTLVALNPPPNSPYLGERDWEEVFAELGTRLPCEYVELISRYGAGQWAGWLYFPPPRRAGSEGMPGVSAQARDGYRELREEWPDEYRLAMWPEPGGFLPVAHSAHGDYLGWLAEGDDPEAWPLIFCPRVNEQGPPLDCGLAELVHALLIGDHERFGFPPPEEDWNEEDPEGAYVRAPDFEPLDAAHYDDRA